MVDSGIEIAAIFAVQGARVIFVCEHRKEVQDMLKKAELLVGEHLARSWKTNGRERIATKQGGVIYLLAPHSTRMRGVSADAIFAPPLVWNDEKLAAGLIPCVNGSAFFGNRGPVMFSTLQRVGGQA